MIYSIRNRLTISSNVAGTVITKFAGDKKRLSIKREDYDILEFEKLITNAASQEEGICYGGKE